MPLGGAGRPRSPGQVTHGGSPWCSRRCAEKGRPSEQSACFQGVLLGLGEWARFGRSPRLDAAVES